MNATKLILAFALIALPSCTRGGPTAAQVKQDFDAICQAQKDYAKSRELLKNAPEAELRAERNRKVAEGRQTEPGLRAVEAVIAAGAGSPKQKVEEAAKAAGLKDWACPEF
ncbi:MAG: hypothetical protein EOP11_09575 [Proteobacteria bacterium]|nr:MAG: hypothetical protein EOP11_09575 [Pseudomonadota bacterium]